MNNQCSLVLIFVSLLKKGTKKSLKNSMLLILLPPPALAWLLHPDLSPPASCPSPALILPGSRPPCPPPHVCKPLGRGSWLYTIGCPKGRNRDVKLVNLSCLTRHINMLQKEEYSSFLNIFTKN